LLAAESVVGMLALVAAGVAPALPHDASIVPPCAALRPSCARSSGGVYAGWIRLDRLVAALGLFQEAGMSRADCRNRLALIATLLALASPCLASRATVDGKTAFEMLKGLEGHWEGTLGTRDGEPIVVDYRVTANGTTVMETMFPGTPEEMVTMYYLEGDELVMTHYCARGNQPRMRLQESSDFEMLSFVYEDGSNVDPTQDTYLRSGMIWFKDGDQIECEWLFYTGAEQTGVSDLYLRRVRSVSRSAGSEPRPAHPE
jgi:hypothetical protein